MDPQFTAYRYLIRYRSLYILSGIFCPFSRRSPRKGGLKDEETATTHSPSDDMTRVNKKGVVVVGEAVNNSEELDDIQEEEAEEGGVQNR